MKISLSPEARKFDVMGEALRLLSEKERIRAKQFAELKEKIRVGIEASERGEVVDGEEFFAELEEEARQLEAEMEAVEIIK